MYEVLMKFAKDALSYIANNKAFRRIVISYICLWIGTSFSCVTVGTAARKWAATRAYNQGYRAGVATCDSSIPDDGQRRRRWWLFSDDGKDAPWAYRWFGAGQPIPIDAVIERHEETDDTEALEAPQ